MATDARIAVGLLDHPKTKKLIKRLGQAAAWNLVRLIVWSSANRSDGNLCGLSVEDIELSADWLGADGEFVKALTEVRFLDFDGVNYLLHDWIEHNPWAAGADARSAKARWNAAKRHHGIAEADRLVPEYAAVRSAASNATSTNTAEADQEHSNAPSPYPSPSPSPYPSQEDTFSEKVVGAADAAATKPESKATRLSADWQLPKAWGDWALAEHPHWTADVVRLEAQKFADHWRAQPGKDGRKSDWPATWRNWCRNDICQRSHPPPSAARPSKRHAMTDDERAAFNATVADKAKHLLFGSTPAPADVIENEPLGVAHEAG